MNRLFLWWSVAAVALTVGGASFVCSMVFARVQTGNGEQGCYVFIDRDDTADSVKVKSGIGWRWECFCGVLGFRPHTGRYLVEPGMTQLMLYRNLRSGIQEPVNIIVPTSRTMNSLAATLSRCLMLDSTEIASALTDSSYCVAHGYTTATIPALFIPNTYEIYWDVSLDGLVERMKRENNRYWTAERDRKSRLCGLTREEVATLASIVDEETANDAEKPMIAGLYLNRLRIGMPLQADPTVKFAVGDFSLRRILNEHLKVKSPYNTYLVEGLPPGPIRIPSIAGLEAVLNHAKHSYIYMCAKEDFSGTHNYSASLAEHHKNARRYVRALKSRLSASRKVENGS